MKIYQKMPGELIVSVIINTINLQYIKYWLWKEYANLVDTLILA